MDKRFAIFLALAFLAITANSLFVAWRRGGQENVAKQGEAIDAKGKQKADGKADAKGADLKDKEGKLPPGDAEKRAGVKPEDGAAAADPAEGAAKPGDEQAEDADKPADEEAEQAKPIAPQWVTLGSVDPDSPYRMLITATNRGAAIERVELSDPEYRDREDRTGYLGHLAAADAPRASGALVRVVGHGTPAAAAGIKPDDVITAIGKERIPSAAALDRVLETTKAGDQAEITVRRGEEDVTVTATLMERTLEIIRPEQETHPLDIVPTKGANPHDPLSFLFTLEQVDDRLVEDQREELAGIDLRKGNWEVASQSQDQVTFRRELTKENLEVTKRYTLAQRPAAGDAEPAYHLELEVEVKNIGDKASQVAYRLDGPTGLPTEGAWYASKVSRNWSAGFRDVVARVRGSKPQEISGLAIADDEAENWGVAPLEYVAVDAQYFSVAMIPQMPPRDDSHFQLVKPIRVGEVPEDKALKKLTNVSIRLVSRPEELAPNTSLSDKYVVFAGPKNPDLLALYSPPAPAPGETTRSLEDLVYYGWFGWVAKPMLWILHSFYSLVGNYGIAIIMLTVLVRGSMLPISRKQAINAQKMQLLMPEIKKLREKYKNDLQQFGRAQQELFRKHNYNQLSGCLPLFIQMPIFIGLYRSLMVDVELRQAPLFSRAIQWCSDLAAPDMLMDWSGFMPHFIAHGTGFFGLGPYLNVLPLVTIVLFLWQQKLFMPPPADEQAALQQKMMTYMMVFMGIMFYKVASGLCIYFIASSLWGIAERKLLPKPTLNPVTGGPQPGVTTRPSGDGKGNGGGAQRRKQRKK